MRLAEQEALENEKRTEMEDQSQKKIFVNKIF